MGRLSKHSPEFREQAIELVRATGKTVAQVARDLQINNTTLGNILCPSVRCDLRVRAAPGPKVRPSRGLGRWRP